MTENVRLPLFERLMTRDYVGTGFVTRRAATAAGLRGGTGQDDGERRDGTGHDGVTVNVQ